MQFSFIHTADLHIESPYKGVHEFNKHLGKTLLKNGVLAFQRLITVALENEVDFLVISGDSFDSEIGSLRAQYIFLNGLNKLHNSGIKVYIICGNHDPLNAWSKHLQLPPNVVLFNGDSVQNHIFRKNGTNCAAIYGVSFTEKEEYRKLAKEFIRTDQTPFAIAMLHGAVAGNQSHIPYCPFELDTLRASGMDYWALGHIHKRQILQENKPAIVYPGNIQGRHFNECDEKGCSLVVVNDGTIITHEFLALSSIIYAYVKMDITAINDIQTFADKIETLKNEKLNQSKNSYLLRIQLTGQTELHPLLAQEQEITTLLTTINDAIDYDAPFIFIDKVINLTTPVIDIQAMASSSDFIADILHQITTLKNHPEKLKASINEIIATLDTSKFKRDTKPIAISETLQTQYLEILEAVQWKLLNEIALKSNT